MLTGEDDYNGVEPAQYDYEEMLTNLQQKRWQDLNCHNPRPSPSPKSNLVKSPSLDSQL